MGEVELRWLIAGVGMIILILIWLWGSRAQLKKQRREQQPSAEDRSPENEPTLDTAQAAPDAEAMEYRFGEFGHITPDHHLADKALVDVEIVPVQRSVAGSAASGRESRPEIALRQAVVQEPAEEIAIHRERYKAQVESVETTSEPAGQVQSRETADEQSKLTIVLTVTAPPGRPFRGASILLAAQELKLKLHKNGIFDYFPDDQAKGKPIFGIGHLREPGTFALDTIGKLFTPGLLMFMNLPGSMAPVEAVDRMVLTARQLAQKLGGTVCNEHRDRMTAQSLTRLRNDAAEFEKRLGLK
jgi:cell division protein ZipA